MNSHNQEEIADMAEMEGFMQSQINISDEQLPNYPMDMNLNPSSSLPSSQESSTTTESSSSISEANPLQGITLETTGKPSNQPVNAQSTTNAEAAPVSLPSNTITSSQAKSIQIIKAGTGNWIQVEKVFFLFKKSKMQRSYYLTTRSKTVKPLLKHGQIGYVWSMISKTVFKIFLNQKSRKIWIFQNLLAEMAWDGQKRQNRYWNTARSATFEARFPKLSLKFF